MNAPALGRRVGHPNHSLTVTQLSGQGDVSTYAQPQAQAFAGGLLHVYIVASVSTRRMLE